MKWACVMVTMVAMVTMVTMVAMVAIIVNRILKQLFCRRFNSEYLNQFFYCLTNY